MVIHVGYIYFLSKTTSIFLVMNTTLRQVLFPLPTFDGWNIKKMTKRWKSWEDIFAMGTLPLRNPLGLFGESMLMKHNFSTKHGMFKMETEPFFLP